MINSSYLINYWCPYSSRCRLVPHHKTRCHRYNVALEFSKTFHTVRHPCLLAQLNTPGCVYWILDYTSKTTYIVVVPFTTGIHWTCVQSIPVSPRRWHWTIIVGCRNCRSLLIQEFRWVNTLTLTITSCSQTLHVLRVLRAHSLPAAAVHEIFRCVTVAKLFYAPNVCWGFSLATSNLV